MFRFLTLLYEDRAYYKDVVEIYKNDVDEKSNNTIQVVINKAINALKVFGIKIIKSNNKYQLESSLYSLNYNIDDLKTISLLIKANETFPDEKVKDDISQIIKELRLRMDNNTRKTLSTLSSNHDFSFFYDNLKDQITQCKELCKNKTTFSITYIKKGKPFSIKGYGKDVIFDTKNAYLQMYDSVNNVIVEIPLPNILKLDIGHSKFNMPETATTVTFKISGRLAKTYKLKENETLLEIDKDKNLIIVNRDEPINKLIPRIMRYSDCCQVIGPKSLKEEIKHIINNTLAQYDKEK